MSTPTLGRALSTLDTNDVVFADCRGGGGGGGQGGLFLLYDRISAQFVSLNI